MNLEEEIALKSIKELTSYISRGITPSYTEEEGVVVINQRCIRDNTIDYENARLTDPNKKKIPEAKYLRKYDVLVNSTGVGTLGRSAQIKEINDPITVDSHVTILRHNDEIDPLYFGYAIQMLEKNIENLAEGSTGQTELSRIRLGDEIFINNLPKNVQKKIGKILSDIDKKIVLNKQINNNLFLLAKYVYKEFYRDKVESYDVKRYVTLDEVTCKFATGLNPRNNFVLGEGNNYYVTIKNMANNSIVLDEKCSPITDEALVKINKRSDLKVGDLLFSGIGTIGRVHLIEEEPTNWNISESVFTMRPNELISSEFLFVLLLSKEVQEYAISLASGSVQKGIRMRDLKNYEFILLDEEDKELLDSLLKPIIGTIKSNEKEIKNLTDLRDTLLPKLMSGEIDVSEVNCDL